MTNCHSLTVADDRLFDLDIINRSLDDNKLSQTIKTLSDTGYAWSLDDELSQTINTLSDTGHARSLDDKLSQSNCSRRQTVADNKYTVRHWTRPVTR